jgi:hypothetical protein
LTTDSIKERSREEVRRVITAEATATVEIKEAAIVEVERTTRTALLITITGIL